MQETLSKYTIKELGNETMKEELLRSLRKGNLQSATFLKDGKEIKCFIQANPQFKTIDMYDQELKKMDNKLFRDVNQLDVECEILGESKKKAMQEDQKESTKPNQTTTPKRSRSHKI